LTTKKEQDPDYWLLFAEAGVPHGIKGAFFLVTSDRRTEAVEYGRVGISLPSGAKGPQGAEEIRPYRVRQSYTSGGRSVIALQGIDTRESAEALLGSKMYIPREDIQLETGEFLVGDLVGTTAFDEGGTCIGSIIAVHNFGAQVNLEIGRSSSPAEETNNAPVNREAVATSSKTFYFPFLDQFILKHDPVAKVIVLKNISDFMD
jgi:16S rRNA processing protein RimM